ncbi:hypothetical protein GCM10007036_14570 [Alsobacter metallidurans]|uniref:Uncharacterized protein n=1 Tax=Alsobacter metallidurans TaxID=340221 RepID=A0A917I655_9HYPH|nr:hypothetical protein [Alsobacter metallidurans]GGH14928.1 hypothetical protein GCM10007036_14570 [Alsobacter metallidurans]
MATGDQPDIVSRLKALLPPTWFTASPIPIVEGLLSGAASMLAGVYAQISFARLQTRISTATGGFLDLIALDYFGWRVMRKTNQSDDSFRARILEELLRPRVTRSSLVAMLTDLTGRAPTVFEPALPADTGGYNLPCMGYSLAGRYGSLQLPCQSFVTVLRPASSGIPSVGGYGAPLGGYARASALEYGQLSQIVGSVTDQDIYDAIESVKPAGTIVWTKIQNSPDAPLVLGPRLDLDFVLDTSALS